MQILLAADAGVGDEAIAASVQTSGSTIYRTKKRFVEISLEAALSEEPRPGAARKLSGKEEVQLVALACSDAPEGCARWTLKLLANALVELVEHQSISRDTIRRRLDDNDLKPWQKKMWCIAKIDSDYIARMEDLLDLYAEPHDPKRPVVCFDESPIQLIGEVRVPITPKPGKRYRYDSEYKRNGTANLFVMVDANRSWRKVIKAVELSFSQLKDSLQLTRSEQEVVRKVYQRLRFYSAFLLDRDAMLDVAGYAISKADHDVFPDERRLYVEAALGWLKLAQRGFFLGGVVHAAMSHGDHLIRGIVYIANQKKALDTKIQAAAQDVGETHPRAVVVKEVGNAGLTEGGKVQKEFETVLGRALPLAMKPDLFMVRSTLLAEFPHATEVADTILDDLVPADDIQFRPTILLGSPGCAKTSFAVRLFEILGVKAVRMRCGSHRRRAQG